MNEVKVMQVIRTTLLVRGKGTEEEPIRRITQYWDMGGILLVEDDPWKDGEWQRDLTPDEWKEKMGAPMPWEKK